MRRDLLGLVISFCSFTNPWSCICSLSQASRCFSFLYFSLPSPERRSSRSKASSATPPFAPMAAFPSKSPFFSPKSSLAVAPASPKGPSSLLSSHSPSSCGVRSSIILLLRYYLLIILIILIDCWPRAASFDIGRNSDMGLAESKNAEMLRFVEREWENVREENGVRVVRNRENDVEAEVVAIVVEPQRNLEKELEIYEYRRKQEDALVSVFAVQNSKNNDSSFCGNTQMLKVVVERIVSRLKDLPQLPLPASLYVLSEVIRGYSVCFKMMGHFQVTSRMIGVNGRGHVKVWLNDNFAENHPVDERPSLYMTSHGEAKERGNREELLMLQELLGVVEEKCENGRFPEEFRSRIYGKGNFVDAYNEIEAFSRERAIEVPASIDVGRLSSSQAKSKSSLMPSLPFITSQYQPRETLIKNLAFSQSNQPYLESPLIHKQESYNRVSSLPAWQPPTQPVRFFPSEPVSSRLPSSQITFNYSKGGFSMGAGQSRF